VHDRETLTARIRSEAVRLGFFKMGVAAAGPLPWARHFDLWLARGMQGEMTYLDRQAARRKDPTLVMENVRSILVLAMNYHVDQTPPVNPLRGRISRYAWGTDYHLAMAKPMRSLVDFIAAQNPGARALWYVDTGPVMEKVWGAQTALGWLGKHSNLVTRERGSWCFLGTILLDFDLAYDDKGRDFCGSCSRCIRACPTGAIPASHRVDARLCISYLTIELKGIIPRHLRARIGNRIFGCDDCLEACPWNRFAVPATNPAFQPREGSFVPELERLATLTNEEFANQFRESAVRRAGRDGFVRNVVVALGNSRSPHALPPLIRAMQDESVLVRAHTAWALGRTGVAGARAALEAAASVESSPTVLEEIELALASLQTEIGA
jgi:epoxyqueuosine reductase